MIRNKHSAWLIVAAALATIAVYWHGLHGPFLLDDFENLMPVWQWSNGAATAWEVILGNVSGPLGRPVSMVSFLLSAGLSGYNEFSFKLGNLIIHLACGLLIWQILQRTLAQDRSLSAHAGLASAAGTALWLLHPLHASTVLYAVQRMAQLGALFVLAALWMYLVSRRKLADGKTTQALAGLFIGFPLLLATGLLSKETAAVAPALCLVFELAYFRDTPRPRVLVWFFGLFLFLPLLVFSSLMLLDPDAILGRYVLWDFTPVERLLTQSRVLLDYIGQLLLPRGAQMGLYHDDFSVSSGLLSPASTLFSILVLVAISVFAVLARRRAPSVFAGWFFFLVAHALESSFLPMDLYFEHRNYLPSVGLLLALAGVFAWCWQTTATNRPLARPLATLIVVASMGTLAFATWGRALAWQDNQTLVREGLKHHPESLRANGDMAVMALATHKPLEFDRAAENMKRSHKPRHHLIGTLLETYATCTRSMDGQAEPLLHAASSGPSKIGLSEVMAYRMLAGAVMGHDCGGVTKRAVADSIAMLLSNARMQPDTVQPKWLLHHVAGDLYFRAGTLEQAQRHALLAWQPDADPSIGALLVQVYARRGMRAEAEQVLAQMFHRLDASDETGRKGLAQLRASLGTLGDTQGNAH